MATATLAPTTAGLYWWVGPCNGRLVGSQAPAAVDYAASVQGDPAGATGEFAAATADNGQAWAHCVAEGGLRPQAVFSERPADVKVINCIDTCVLLAWEGWGPARLTLRCLDDNSVTTTIFPEHPRIPHGCIVESTLEANGTPESLLVWEVSACRDPRCTPWPYDVIGNEPAP